MVPPLRPTTPKEGSRRRAVNHTPGAMRFEDAAEKFRAKNEQGEIPNRKTGGTHSISENRCAAVISAARRGLHRATDRANVGPVDLAPYAETLPEHARAYARERGRSHPDGYASRARLFLQVVEGKVYQQQRQGRSRVLEAWRPLYEALEARGEREELNWGFRAAFRKLQNLALLHEVRRPEELPGRETLEAWAGEAEDISPRYFRRMLEAYWIGRRELDDTELPVLKTRVRENERGLRSLSNLPEVLAEHGHRPEAPYELTGPEILRMIAPKVAQTAADYVESVSGDSSSVEKKAWGAASRAAAEAIRLGHDPSDLHVPQLFQPVLERSLEIPSYQQDLVDDGARVTETVSLLGIMLDDWAERSWANSALTVESGEDDFWYTHTVRQDVEHLYRMVMSEYTKTLDDSELQTIKEEYEQELTRRMEEHNDNHVVAGQKDKERFLRTMTWPQLVCIGLPALRERVFELRDHYFAQVERQDGELGAGGVHRARTRYFSALEKYLATALVADDGLRMQNYSGAQVGKHVEVVPEVEETDEGEIRWAGLERVATHFFGQDPEHVRLKKDTDENGRNRDRHRDVNRDIVDFTLLKDYLLDARPYRLSQAGLIGDEEDFDPRTDDDRYALFVSPRSSRPDGRYGKKSSLSHKIGKALLWIAGDVLGRDVPDWTDEARTGEWRELWAGHIVRLLITTYWGGLRGEWAYAERLTDDTRRTLERAYDRAASGAMQAKMRREGWENPHHFDEICDRLRHGKEVDWEAVREAYDMPAGR